MKKLDPKRIQETREYLDRQYASGEMQPGIMGILRDFVEEVERTRPKWQLVSADLFKTGPAYHVAGTTEQSEKPVWLGRGRYDSEWSKWVDVNTGRPFPVTTTITHYYQELTPTEFIGQPE